MGGDASAGGRGGVYQSCYVHDMSTAQSSHRWTRDDRLGYACTHARTHTAQKRKK